VNGAVQNSTKIAKSQDIFNRFGYQPMPLPGMGLDGVDPSNYAEHVQFFQNILNDEPLNQIVAPTER